MLIVSYSSHFVTSINKMVAAYESDTHKDKRRVEEAPKDARLLKSKLDEAEGKHAAELASTSTRIKVPEDEQKMLREKNDQVASLDIRL